MKASDIAATAASLMSGDREQTHGPKRQNHDNIAALWNAYLAIRREPRGPLSAADVAHMMALLKVARTQLGANNVDDWIDGAAYMSIAGELAELEAPQGWPEADGPTVF
jgi:hypothetical protein